MKCPTCGQDIPRGRKYCSNRCAALGRWRDQETRHRIMAALPGAQARAGKKKLTLLCCRYCRLEFLSLQAGARYCSLSCAARYRNNLPQTIRARAQRRRPPGAARPPWTFTCEFCGTPQEVAWNGRNTTRRRFCNRSCAAQDREKKKKTKEDGNKPGGSAPSSQERGAPG